MEAVKKIVTSKYFRLVFSVILIYFAFSRVNLNDLWKDLVNVPWWLMVALVVYGFLGVMIGSVRWAYLLLEKPGWRDFLLFSKLAYMGAFYGLFLSSSVGGDLVKWLPLIKKYPHLTKGRIAASVLIDRILGLSGLAVVAFFAVLVGKLAGFEFPNFLFWFFCGMFVAMLVFYYLIFTVDFEKYLGKNKFLRRVLQVVGVLKGEKKKRLALGLLLSLVGQPFWIANIWFISVIVGAGMTWLSIFIFVPVVSLIITLPISVAGFGAREQLYLYFFGQIGLQPEKILLVSTVGGAAGVVGALIGGLLLLF